MKYCLYCETEIPDEMFKRNDGLCDLCKPEADRREESRHNLIYG